MNTKESKICNKKQFKNLLVKIVIESYKYPSDQNTFSITYHFKLGGPHETFFFYYPTA